MPSGYDAGRNVAPSHFHGPTTGQRTPKYAGCFVSDGGGSLGDLFPRSQYQGLPLKKTNPFNNCLKEKITLPVPVDDVCEFICVTAI